MLKEEPKPTIGEIGKATGAAWREMSDKDKKKYEDLVSGRAGEQQAAACTTHRQRALAHYNARACGC